MLQNKQWGVRASTKHFDSHPVFFFRTSTNFFSRLFCNPIGQGKKKGIHRIFGHIPPKPLPFSHYVNCNRFVKWARRQGLRVCFVKIGGEK